MNSAIGKEGESPQFQFCALEYRSQNLRAPAPRSTPIVLVLRDEEGCLRFLFHPALRVVVEPEDLDYIESLLKDFVERAKLHPADLFKQLSSLNVGPLVTHEIGSSLLEFPAIQRLSTEFVPL